MLRRHSVLMQKGIFEVKTYLKFKIKNYLLS